MKETVAVLLILLSATLFFKYNSHLRLEDKGSAKEIVAKEENIAIIKGKNTIISVFGQSYLLTNGKHFPYLVQKVRLLSNFGRYWLFSEGDPIRVSSAEDLLKAAHQPLAKKTEANEYWQQIEIFYGGQKDLIPQDLYVQKSISD